MLDGVRLVPKLDRLWTSLEALPDLADLRIGSPQTFQSLLGSTQWLHLLARPLFSTLHASYAFAGTE